MTGLGLFLCEALKHPQTIGAVFPSSKKLATALAQQILSINSGLIVELGAGTGAITEALLKHKNPTNHLIAVEQSVELAKHLATRFPHLKVIQGNANQLQQLLSKDITTPVQAIVSSLPLRSLPSETIKKIGQEINCVLAPEGIFIQYTYNIWGETLILSPQLKRIRSQWIWQNLPPTRIDIFCRK